MVIGEARTNVAERRQHLLDVARDIFAERGYQATTMDDVANAAGFTKPILYQHFASKESLYNEIVESTSAQLIAALTAATAHLSNPRDMVNSAFRAFFEIVINETAAFRLLFLQPPVGDPTSELRRIETTLTSFIEERIPLPSNPDYRRQLASSLVGMAEGAATTWLMQQQRDGWPPVRENEVDRLATQVATLAWGGLRAVKVD
jgi:AcrR family transcriptional regulator